MAVDAQIVVGIKGDIEGGRRIKRTLDDISSSGAKVESSSKRLSKGFEDADRRANSFSNSVSILKRAFVGFLGVATVRKITSISDSFTEVENRLKVVTDSTEEFSASLSEVSRIANTTRQSITDTANVYSRFAIATEDLNLSFEEQSKLIQGIQQTFRIAGASTQEAANASIQLAQGLAAGALRGDEFRSVSEQNAVLTGLLADNLGVTRGALKDLAADGKITADVVINSIVPAFDDLNKQADELQLKTGEAFTLLSNQFTEVIGKSQAVQSITDGFSKSIVALADNLKTVAQSLVIVSGAIGGYVLATRGLALATATSSGVIATFNALILANPVGLLIAALAAAGTAAFVFKDEMEAGIVFAMVEVIAVIDQAIVKIKEFARFTTTGLEASFAGIKNILGITSDQEFDRRLLFLKSLSEKPTTSGINVGLIRQSANDLIEDLAREQGPPRVGGGLSFRAPSAPPQPTQNFAQQNNLDAINEALKEIDSNIIKSDQSVVSFEDSIDGLKRTTDGFANSIADAFAGFVSGTASAKDALRGLANDLLRIATRQFITAPLSGALGSLFSGIAGGFGGGGGAPVPIPNPFRSAPIPGFASGGSMVLGGVAGNDQNLLSLNGQPISRVSRGETVSISPDQKMGSGITVNQNINVSTGVIDTVKAEIFQLMPQIQESTRAAIQEAQLRGVS
jgi:tape measure domain-containing protein